MSELPKGWQLSVLSTAGKWGSGGTPSRKEPKYFGGKIPWIKSGDLCDGPISSVEEKITEEALKNSAAKLLPVGTVSIALYGATIGKLGILTFEAATNQACANCIVNEQVVNPRYLFHYLRSQRKALVDKGQGGAQPNISQEILKEHPLPLAPLNEQKRIVAKLDELLPKVEACKERLQKIPVILKRFRQSVLAAAVSGRLTEEWRKERNIIDDDGEDLPSGWGTVKLRDVVEKFHYGSSAKSDKSGKIPVLRMGNIQNGEIDWSDLVYSNNQDEIKKYSLLKNTVLFNRTNSPELVGKTAIYRGERPAMFAGYLIRLICGPRLNAEYLNLCLNSPMARSWCSEVKSDGVSQSNINAQKLADFQIALPSLEEQEAIVKQVREQLSRVDKTLAGAIKALKYINRSSDAILSKAFSGELTLQDPSDEPASALLERIKQTTTENQNGNEKPKAKSVKRGRKGSNCPSPPILSKTSEIREK